MNQYSILKLSEMNIEPHDMTIFWVYLFVIFGSIHVSFVYWPSRVYLYLSVLYAFIMYRILNGLTLMSFLKYQFLTRFPFVSVCFIRISLLYLYFQLKLLYYNWHIFDTLHTKIAYFEAFEYTVYVSRNTDSQKVFICTHLCTKHIKKLLFWRDLFFRLDYNTFSFTQDVQKSKKRWFIHWNSVQYKNVPM